jgi:DNA-binding transcriptional LysR family regulator
MLNLRHLRCFRILAEELHFGRAAARLHMEPPPLSRVIKDLESELGALLFDRSTRSTHITRAGSVLLEHVPQIFAAIQQARDAVASVHGGYEGQLRIALSDGVSTPPLPRLLAQCRQAEPDLEIRVCEVPLAQQIAGLRDHLYDVGFAQCNDLGDGLVAVPVWHDPLVVAVPVEHPLAAHSRLRLEDVLCYPLVMFHPQLCDAQARQIADVLRTAHREPLVLEQVTTPEAMMTLIGAGFALGLMAQSRCALGRDHGVAGRRLVGRSPMLTTYLVRADVAPSAAVARFVERIAGRNFGAIET